MYVHIMAVFQALTNSSIVFDDGRGAGRQFWVAILFIVSFLNFHILRHFVFKIYILRLEQTVSQ